MNVSVYGMESVPVVRVANPVALTEARRRMAEKAFRHSRFRSAEETGEWEGAGDTWTRDVWIEDLSAESGEKRISFVVEFKHNAAIVINTCFLDAEAY